MNELDGAHGDILDNNILSSFYPATSSLIDKTQNALESLVFFTYLEHILQTLKSKYW